MNRPFVGFDWDAGNTDKCCRHGLSTVDIEHVVAHQESLIVPDVRNSATEPRFIAVGRTIQGRYAFVVFTPRTKDGETYARPISARYMHRKEIERYAQEISGAQDR
jgi:uncharacterized protein